MKKYIFLFLVFSLVFPIFAQGADQSITENNNDHLIILWTSGDVEVFSKVVFPYALNSKKMHWWDKVTLIIWGPSTRLLAGDKETQEKLGHLQEAAVQLEACLWCADQYGDTEKLKELGVDVKYMGKPLTDYLKSEGKVIVF